MCMARTSRYVFARDDLHLSLENCPGQTRREAGTQSQGSPIGDRPAAGSKARSRLEEPTVKANLARFTTALALLATMALSLGAGTRWF
jgi:hypothetical protein